MGGEKGGLCSEANSKDYYSYGGTDESVLISCVELGGRALGDRMVEFSKSWISMRDGMLFFTRDLRWLSRW